MTGYHVVSWAFAFHSMKLAQSPMSPATWVWVQSTALPPNVRADCSQGPSMKACVLIPQTHLKMVSFHSFLAPQATEGTVVDRSDAPHGR